MSSSRRVAAGVKARGYLSGLFLGRWGSAVGFVRALGLGRDHPHPSLAFRFPALPLLSKEGEVGHGAVTLGNSRDDDHPHPSLAFRFPALPLLSKEGEVGHGAGGGGAVAGEGSPCPPLLPPRQSGLPAASRGQPRPPRRLWWSEYAKKICIFKIICIFALK